MSQKTVSDRKDGRSCASCARDIRTSLYSTKSAKSFLDRNPSFSLRPLCLWGEYSLKEASVCYPSPHGSGARVREAAPIPAKFLPHPGPLPEGEGIDQTFLHRSSLGKF